MSKPSIRPLHDRVVVKRLPEQTKTAGGIIIPDTAKEKPQEGEVLAVGNGFVMQDGSVRPLEVKIGDKVLFGKWGSTTEINVNGEELLVMKEDDIIAVYS
ncbi:MAG: co-chaperone GroES [Magnetococcales bacterium]|nr:co-chaperone GroES [Magnetococcales bacterium]|tara:strand:+ start:1540 stop:1839 length:300 start_codon:yes stop_codon:yes gene_type:complete